MTLRSFTLAAIAGLALIASNARADEGTPMGRLKAACGRDIQDFCSDAEQDLTHIETCLGSHRDRITDECQRFHAAARARVHAKVVKPAPQLNPPQAQ